MLICMEVTGFNGRIRSGVSRSPEESGKWKIAESGERAVVLVKPPGFAARGAWKLGSSPSR